MICEKVHKKLRWGVQFIITIVLHQIPLLLLVCYMSNFASEYKNIMAEKKLNGTRLICHPKDIMKDYKIRLRHTTDLVVYIKLFSQWMFITLQKFKGRPFCHGKAASLRDHGLLIIEASRSHSDTPHSVGLLWMNNQSDAETSDNTQL
jgi:hypothetical protein